MSQVQRLDSVAEITMGQAPAGESYNVDGNGMPLIAGAGDFGEVHPAPKKYTTAPGKICLAGDIILGIRATIGKKVLAGRQYCLGRGVAGLRARPSLDGRYLWHWLTHAAPSLATKAKGATFKQVNRQDIGALHIPVPPVSEQKGIAKILDKVDALRAKRRAALAQLDILTQSIFLDMFGDPATNPKGWPEVALGAHTSKIGSGATPLGGEAAYKKDGIALIRSMNVRDGRFSQDGLAFIDDQQAARLDGVVVEPDDVLLNITGASVARVCRAPRDVLPARVNQHVAIIRPTSGFDLRFLEQCLLFPSMKRRLLRIAGAGATREAITKDAIERLTVIQPPRNEQDRLADIHVARQGLEVAQGRHLMAADALFSSLQHRAFRGEL